MAKKRRTKQSMSKRLPRASGDKIDRRGHPELIVAPHDDARRLFVGDDAPAAKSRASLPFRKLIETSGARFAPIQPRRLKGTARAPAAAPAQPPRFFHVAAPDSALAELHHAIVASGMVSAAYIKPASTVPIINRMTPSAAPTPPQTPDFSANQIYLGNSPTGVGARTSWLSPGGKGEGVQVIDLEWAWQTDHEDLQQNKLGLLGGTADGPTDHGTAVIGVIGADENGFGVTGIAPAASIGLWAFDSPTSQAIDDAAMRLGAGDIMLLEIHRPGPRYNFQERDDQLGYIAIEWWPDDLEAIQFAVSRGIIVVEAAGNGSENLDDPLYNTGAGFGTTWSNPFASTASGAIVVGAGAPPPGTHGKDHGPDRSRLDFSNFGARLDVQGWGREVTTSGYGDLQGGDVRRYYTNSFSGTSSASPVVVGALACVQSRLVQLGRPRLTAPEARAALRATGAPQQAAPGRPASERIGARPDIQALIAWAQARA